MRHGDHFAFLCRHNIISPAYLPPMDGPSWREEGICGNITPTHNILFSLSLSLEIPVVDRRGRCPSRDSETRTFFY